MAEHKILGFRDTNEINEKAMTPKNMKKAEKLSTEDNELVDGRQTASK